MFNDTSKAAALERASRGTGGKKKKVRGAVFHAAIWQDVFEDIQGDAAAYLKRHGVRHTAGITRFCDATVSKFATPGRDPRTSTTLVMMAFTSPKLIRFSATEEVMRRIQKRKKQYERTAREMEASLPWNKRRKAAKSKAKAKAAKPKAKRSTKISKKKKKK